MDERTRSSRRLSPGKVSTLVGLVDRADGAIVSRTLIDGPGGSVTLFSFDAGQALSEHTAPYDALVHVLDGEGEFTIAGETHRVGSGEIVLMPADLPHAVRAVVPFKMLLVMVKSEGGIRLAHPPRDADPAR